MRRPPRSTLFPYTPLFRSVKKPAELLAAKRKLVVVVTLVASVLRSEEHTSELQSTKHLVCRLLLEKKKEMETPITGSFMLRVTGMQLRGLIGMKSFAMTSNIFPATLNPSREPRLKC